MVPTKMMKICDKCGKEFLAVKNATTCSKACSKARALERASKDQKIYRDKNPESFREQRRRNSKNIRDRMNALGFRQRTYFVHDDDVDAVRSYIDKLNAERGVRRVSVAKYAMEADVIEGSNND